MQNLMDIRNAADFLGISRHTLAGWVSQRRVAFVKIGRRRLFRREDLEVLIMAGLHKPKFRLDKK